MLSINPAFEFYDETLIDLFIGMTKEDPAERFTLEQVR